MAKLAIVVLTLCVLGAFAQVPTIMDLTAGATPAAGILPPTTLALANYAQNYYRYWVPANVRTLSFTFTQTDTACTSDIRYYIHGDHIPCGFRWSEGSNSDFPCRDGETAFFAEGSPDVVPVFPGSDSVTNYVTPGSFLYVTIERDIPASDYDETCTYTILTTVTTCDTAGQVGLNDGSSTLGDCVGVTDITLPYSANWVNSGLTDAYFRVWVPQRTAHVVIYINNTESSTYFRGNPFFPSGSSYSVCSDTASYNSETQAYELAAACFNLPVGWFYFNFYTFSSGVVLTGNVSITIKTCDETRAGYNCTYQAWNLTGQPALTAAPLGIEVGEGGWPSSSYDDGFKQWYFSAPNGTLATYNFTVTLTTAQSSSWLYYRRNGYIADVARERYSLNSLTANTAETVALLWHDIYVGGNFYFGVSNEGSATINFTVSTAATAINPSTGPAPTTEAASTTTGSASGIFASFALIAALIALLF